MYTKNLTEKIEDSLLATHISNNPEFEGACLSGNGLMIMNIIEAEMEKNNLYTKGSKKLQADIIKKLKGQLKVSTYVGQEILFFVYNSRLAGIGLAVN
jgi:hypothetical protein